VARITVNPARAAAAPVLPTDSELFMKNMRDVFFNFDDARIRDDQASTTEKDADFLGQHPNLKILIEGHCDDRGSEIYNLALGESRASSVKEALIRQGIDPSRIATISYGRERPFCTQDNETCWQENRRDHILPK
jgi:peptidoglycan-associated lipoprotein